MTPMELVAGQLGRKLHRHKRWAFADEVTQEGEVQTQVCTGRPPEHDARSDGRTVTWIFGLGV
jgi:hypothetical protein